jgi:hypothetical protein
MILDPPLFSLLPVDSLARTLDIRSVGDLSFWRVAIERRCLFYSWSREGNAADF